MITSTILEAYKHAWPSCFFLVRVSPSSVDADGGGGASWPDGGRDWETGVAGLCVLGFREADGAATREGGEGGGRHRLSDNINMKAEEALAGKNLVVV